MNQMSKKFNYENIEIGYYDNVFHRNYGSQSKWHHLKFKHLMNKLGDYSRHLDIGCGPGTFIGMLSNNRQSIGIDISQKQIDYAQKQYGCDNHKFILFEKDSLLPFPNEYFDVITIIELIEHLNPDQCRLMIQEAYRILSPNGHILITTPNYSSLWPVFEKVVNLLTPVSYKDQHIFKFKRKSLINLFEYCQLNNYSINKFQSFAFFFAYFNWNLPDLINEIEFKIFNHRLGLLLIAEIKKNFT
tara:strand:- start:2470 stop:3201 length:732 start_codon:yes stop_codon:yes gene_type:complete